MAVLNRPGRGLFQALASILEVVRVDFVSETIAAPTRRRDLCGARSYKWVENRVSNETEHANEHFRQGEGERRGVMLVEAPVTPVRIC